LVLAQELRDRAVEAQSCYSLGNTYTLLRDYPMAVEYHLRHLIIAQQLMDRVGEGMLQLNVVRDFILIIRPTRCTNFSNLFLE